MPNLWRYIKQPALAGY